VSIHEHGCSTVNKYRIPNLARACQVLKLFAGSEARLSSSEVARRLTIPRTTALRILLTLAEEGLIAREGADYRAGSELVRLGLRALDATPIRARAVPVLRTLSAGTGETAHLAVLSGDQSLIVEVCDSPNPVRAASRPGTLAGIHCSATGKVFLAFGFEGERRDAFVAGLSFEGRTRQTLTSAAALLGECADIERRGYAVDDEEYHPGVRCLAAPVWDGAGVVVAAIGITASTISFPKRRISLVARHVLDAAAALSADLGPRTAMSVTGG
jgi:DNA-binding IclR family transcriptional regulator